MNRSSALYMIPLAAVLGFAAPASAQVARPGAIGADVGTGTVEQVQWGYGYGPRYGYAPPVYRGYGPRYGYGPRPYGWGHRGYYGGPRGFYGHRRYGW